MKTPSKKIRRVYLLKAKPIKLAYEAEYADEADAFADEFNRREALRKTTGLVAFADHQGAIHKQPAKRPTKKPAKRLAKGGASR